MIGSGLEDISAYAQHTFDVNILFSTPTALSLQLLLYGQCAQHVQIHKLKPRLFALFSYEWLHTVGRAYIFLALDK